MQILRWSDQRPGERVLRVWLGATFAYAGVQKLSDPGFFHKGSTTYIGSQLDGFSNGSPIGPLLDLLNHAPVLAGAGVAVTEILIGLATLAGVAPSVAAFAGMGLSVSLWLSASWHIHPYFLGSDSIYAIAWLAYALSLPGTVAAWAALRTRSRPDVVDDGRRQALRGGAVVAGGLALGGVAAAIGSARDSDAPTVATKQPAPTPTPTPTASPTGSASSAGGVVITDTSTLDANGAVDFKDEQVGDAVVVALDGGAVAAFSRTCTHSQCTASYDTSSKLIVCPCHGSRFDPAQNGAAVQGPATQPLAEVPVQVDGTQVRRG